VREIDDAALDKGAAVGDADFHSFAIVEVDNPEPGVEGRVRWAAVNFSMS